MERIKYLIIPAIFLLFLSIFNLAKENVKYEIGECNFSVEKNHVNYDVETKTFSAYVIVNCCGVNISVKKENHTYKIFEKQYGNLCRCVCYRKIVIYDVSNNADIIFINTNGDIIKLK
jgi:hypothetical protein